MAWGFSNIGDYVNQSDIARKAIVQKCHDVGYIIPTDEMREESGEDPITITDIPNWLYKLNQAVMVVTTTSIQKIQLQSWLLDNVPDLKVKWDWTGKEIEEEELEPATKYLSDNLIQYDYGFVGNHKFALFSPSKLEKVSSYAFLNNNMIKEVELTPVISELARSSFLYTSNLDTVTFGPNIKTIRPGVFYQCKIKSITLPKSVEKIYGTDTFMCPLTSFVIPEDSNLKELHGHWIFNFQGKTKDEYIYIPSGCKFYQSNGTQICYDNVETNIMTQNPFTRAFNHFKFGGNTTEDVMMSDISGVVYLKDSSSNPIAMMNYPSDNTLDSYTIPSTVKYIAHSALMNVPNGQTLKIPSTIEYIHPYFLYWVGRMMKFSSSNGRYKNTQYGGLMTYSTTDFSGEPDVILQEAPVTLDTYEFPSNFKSLRDFKNVTVNANNLINSNSTIQNVKLNRGFPSLPNLSYNGPFLDNPRQYFQYSDISCDNYTIEDGGKTLYMKNGDNRHYTLIGTSYDIEDFSIHEDCKQLYHSVFYTRNGLSGTLDLGNMVNCQGYVAFQSMKNVDTIKFGNELVQLNGYMNFAGNNMSKLMLGTDENSKLKNIGGQSMFSGNPKLSCIWMPGLNVSSIPAQLFSTRTESEPILSIHVHFWTDSTKTTHTTTYNTMKSQKYTETTPYNRVIMVDIPW